MQVSRGSDLSDSASSRSEADLEDGTGFGFWSPKVCPPGYVAELGRDNCISIGDECPEGIWPENLPDSNVKYVTPGGTGDGSSKENPSGSIQAMLNSGVSGMTIALSKGEFNGDVMIRRDHSLIGACAKETTIIANDVDPEYPGIVKVTGDGGGVIQNVGITGAGVGISLST